MTTRKTYAEMVREDRRLAILRLLNEANGKQLNSSTMHASLIYLKIICERHELIEDLRFLQMHGLVEMEQLGDVNPDLYGVHLRGRGEDVIAGHVTVDGVSRPRRA